MDNVDQVARRYSAYSCSLVPMYENIQIEYTELGIECGYVTSRNKVCCELVLVNFIYLFDDGIVKKGRYDLINVFI